MAKIDLKFLDFSDDSWIKAEQQETQAKQYICIDTWDYVNNQFTTIYLDKSTSIKFAKTLRTEINKIESEGSNG